MGGSFNGRTTDSGSANQGSNPCPPEDALDWKSLGIEVRPFLERFPALFGDLGAEPALAVDGASQNFSSPPNDYKPRLKGERPFDALPVQKRPQSVSLQVNDIPGRVPAEKVKPGRGRLPHGSFRAEKGDTGALDLQLNQDFFQFRMIPDDPGFSFPLKKAKPFESLLRDSKPVREVIQNLLAFSFACEGGQ